MLQQIAAKAEHAAAHDGCHAKELVVSQIVQAKRGLGISICAIVLGPCSHQQMMGAFLKPSRVDQICILREPRSSIVLVPMDSTLLWNGCESFKVIDLLGVLDAPTKIYSENTMKIEKHALVCCVAGLSAVAKFSNTTYLLRIPAAVGALLDKNFVALLVEKGFKLCPNMQRDPAAFVILVDLSHDTFILRQNID